MNRILLYVLVVLMAVSCGPNKKELASALLQEAQVAMVGSDFNRAKLKVDSINLLFPDQIEEVVEGQRMMQRIELDEQELSLGYYDTILVKRKTSFEELKSAFVYQKGKFEGYAGTYIHKRQQVKNSHDRCYVRAYLDEKGDFYISSRFHGKGHIQHNSIKVYDDGLFAKTAEIPSSSFDNRTFDDGEDYWETVNYRDGSDNGVVSFVVNNYDSRLKVQFIGKKHHYIVMESFDKEAIRDAYNLSLVIKEIAEMETSKTATEERIAELKKALDLN